MPKNDDSWGDYWKNPLSFFLGIDLSSTEEYVYIRIDSKPYDIQGRINTLDKLIDKSLAVRDKTSFMKYSKERNILMLEV